MGVWDIPLQYTQTDSSWNIFSYARLQERYNFKIFQIQVVTYQHNIHLQIPSLTFISQISSCKPLTWVAHTPRTVVKLF